ncbi:hypothetical protein HK105_206913 [Polyrhizophydium stewartii]|uniref:Uncharacterized protein n=1 Tax=Polyrhizophydium stewartii TaxID=2732419 RepID=A0ABR4N262_9FUNG
MRKLDASLTWVRKLNRAQVALTEDAANFVVRQYAAAGLPHRAMEWMTAALFPVGVRLSQQSVMALLAAVGNSAPEDSRRGSEHISLSELWSHVCPPAEQWPSQPPSGLASSPLSQRPSLPAAVVAAFALAHGRIGNIDGALEALRVLGRPQSPLSSSLQRHERQLLDELLRSVCLAPKPNVRDAIKVWKALCDAYGPEHASAFWLLRSVRSKDTIASDMMLVLRTLIQSPSDEISQPQLAGVLHEMLAACRPSCAEPLAAGSYDILARHWITALPDKLDRNIAAHVIEASVANSTAATIVTLRESLKAGVDIDDAIEQLRDALERQDDESLP